MTNRVGEEPSVPAVEEAVSDYGKSNEYVDVVFVLFSRREAFFLPHICFFATIRFIQFRMFCDGMITPKPIPQRR